MESANSPTFLKIVNAKNQLFVLSLQKIMVNHEIGGPGARFGSLCPFPRPRPKTATG